MESLTHDQELAQAVVRALARPPQPAPDAAALAALVDAHGLRRIIVTLAVCCEKRAGQVPAMEPNSAEQVTAWAYASRRLLLLSHALMV